MMVNKRCTGPRSGGPKGAKPNFLGNFWNIARMHNYTDLVRFLEKSMVPFLRKVAKTSFFGHFWPFLRVFGQNEENRVKYQKSAQYIFLPLHVS